MVLESKITSPHRRQNPFHEPSFRKSPQTRADELGSFSTVVHRHRFLLTALAFLTLLCTIYLYFAIRFGDDDPCLALKGTKKPLCLLEQAKQSVYEGKLKFF